MRNFLRTVFFSPDGTVRGGWVLLLFVLVSSAVSAAFFFVAKLAGVRGGGTADASPLRQAVFAMVRLATTVVATWVAMKVARQRFGWAFFADPRWARRFAGGLLGGIVIVSASALIAWAAGHFAFAVTTQPGGALARSFLEQSLLIFPAAIWEETMMRGLMLQQLARALAGLVVLGAAPMIARRVGAFASVAVTSLLFALMHAGNPEVSAFALANIALVGLVFGALTVRHGSLWAAAGLHIAWNWWLSIFWGLPVSGYDFGLSLLEPTEIGDPLWTGGGFGPEASAVTTFVLSVALVVVMVMKVKEVANLGNLGPALRPPAPVVPLPDVPAIASAGDGDVGPGA